MVLGGSGPEQGWRLSGNEEDRPGQGSQAALGVVISGENGGHVHSKCS